MKLKTSVPASSTRSRISSTMATSLISRPPHTTGPIFDGNFTVGQPIPPNIATNP